MISYKTYNYSRCTTYYLTMDGKQFGGPLFSMKEVREALDRVKELMYTGLVKETPQREGTPNER